MLPSPRGPAERARLAFYNKVYPDLFNLGPGATPDQVTVLRDHPSTLPIECHAYILAHTLNHWSFAIRPVQYCPA